MKTYIHINRHKIDSNRKHNRTDPVITVKNYKSNRYAKKVDILDKDGKIVASVIYSPKHPLSCGATTYILVEGSGENLVLDGVQTVCCPLHKRR